MADSFEGRTVYIATKHRKEDVIAPLLTSSLKVICRVTDLFDTDELGTFSGEIERKLNPADAARAKCDKVHQLTGADLVIASEGSFGPHPGAFFIAADDELILLKDYEHGLEFWSREISTETNFAAHSYASWHELLNWSAQVGFPKHGLILKTPHKVLAKGITDVKVLAKYIEDYAEEGGLTIETDMRACYNPTRMQVIARATEKLIASLKNVCPECQTPGVTVRDVITGLPCELCGSPTASTKLHRLGCLKCSYTTDVLYPHGKKTEDPTYCDTCNP